MANPVRELREAAGLSQAELAERSGVAQPNIAAYEAGRRRASAAMLERLRKAARPLPHDALAVHRDELVALAHSYGLSNIRVFGSAARGTDRPGSDLDILVSRAPGTGLMTLAAFAERASDLLGVEVDVVTDGGLRVDHEILTSAVAV
ncbi:helix-turn-helix domain-containing protein [Raineyella fluvialis]|uniref:Helix-turn-helix domain-containing protein n=1 Tax=Raineyella fluvialis TaxID=2662261 RepID=A0A5Q2FB71_9ACTN|nr:helix-turn-helix domain-containing protein [Raineyella fluvialis]QGF24122.1 helix-turn-helix domain-containing protein [Raineyella fluvialis]